MTDQHWTVIEATTPALKPMQQATTVMCSDHVQYLAPYIPMCIASTNIT